MTTQPKPPKRWYTRRRYWSLAILAVLVYFCLIPSPLRVSPQTTGFTEPLLPNGDVDYFGVYERMYIDKLSPPEDNGQRLLIAALGPRILEQAAIANNVPWEQMPTHEYSKNWFEKQWVPLCEHMFIDPYIKPKFLDNRDYYRFMRTEWEAKNPEDILRNKEAYNDVQSKQDEELRRRLIAAPWTAEEHPNVARWLEERSPVLDLFGEAVRKPNFVCWRLNPGNLYAILLPDVQANRNFGRELSVRVTERLGRGDVDGAWYDVMSMLYLSRKHYIHDPIIVTNLVGIAIEEMGRKSAELILRQNNLTPEQLERFAQDLDSLPRKSVLSFDLEHTFVYSGLQILQNDMDIFVALVGGNQKPSFTNLETFFLWLFGGGTAGESLLPRYITLLPFDRNIAGKRMTDFFQTAQQKSGTLAWNINSTVVKQYLKNMEELALEKKLQLESSLNLLRVPLIRTRSELIADSVISLFLPAMQAAQHALDRANTHFELLRLAVALERYKADNEKYPQALDELVPKYLIEVPLEPFTGRQSFVYKPAPDADTAFLIHSAQWDETGKDGHTKDLFLRMGNVIQ